MHQADDLTPGASTSLWMTRLRACATGHELVDGTSADVCVVGAGIAGLTTAYQCLERGMSVVVLEGGAIGQGETLRTSAHLASALDDRFTSLERNHGTRGAQLLANAHDAAIDWIETFCLTHALDCGFQRVPGYLFGREGGSEAELVEERDAAQRAGLSAELVPAPPLPEMGALPALRFDDQAEIDPDAYLVGLAEAVGRSGGRVFEHVVVERVDEGADMRAPSTVVLRDGRRVVASHVVVATNAPITSVASLPLKQAAHRSYVLAFVVEAGRVPRGLYWDMESPYHYVRVARGDSKDEELLIVGGEDHKTGQAHDPLERFARLESWARARFGFLGDVRHRWSGQIMEPADGAGFVGKNPGSRGSVYVISGDSGNGLTLGTVGAHVVADLIEGRPTPWQEVFDPSRRMLRVVGTLLAENANVAAQYTDLVSKGDVPSVDDIPPGEGAIVRRGVSLLAVFRDAHGQCHTHSAICPHLGGVVRWNAAEHSWDCPCHGSRFDAHGRVIIGPATSDLALVEDEMETPAPALVADAT